MNHAHPRFSYCATHGSKQDAVLLQGGPHDAAVNFSTYRSLQRCLTVFTAIATLSN